MNINNNRALLDATWMDDLSAMHRAIADGANVDARDAEHQETPLMLVQSRAAALLLLEHGADVSLRDNRGQTAFMSHRWSLLAEHGSDVNAQDTDGQTALMKAVMGADPEDVKQVLALGGSPYLCDNDGKTALSIAEEWGLIAIAALLMSDRGYDQE